MNQASTQSEYNSLLDSESRDLIIRELRHNCAEILKKLLNLPKGEDERAEMLFSFFNDRRDNLEREFPPRVVYLPDVDRGVSFQVPDMHIIDTAEIEDLTQMLKDISARGQTSYFIQDFMNQYLQD